MITVPKENVKLAYYNEFDKDKAAWLRELIKARLIAPGEVDDRSIAEINANELVGYTQCHFFAGIGAWSYALRLAGWGDSRQVWTGSCPCPSFSVAGKGGGFADPRHLWPIWFNLIRECSPRTVFGEQADGAVGHGWLDLVATDMEAEKYAFAAAVLGAHSAGATHKRQRLYFVGRYSGADSNNDHEHGRSGLVQDGRIGGQARNAEVFGPQNGQWSAEPRPDPVAYGVTNRVVKLRGFGDAIVAKTAAHFIAAAMAA